MRFNGEWLFQGAMTPNASHKDRLSCPSSLATETLAENSWSKSLQVSKGKFESINELFLPKVTDTSKARLSLIDLARKWTHSNLLNFFHV